MFPIRQRLYTASEVRQLDRLAIDGQGIDDHGIDGYELMCRAGSHTADAAMQRWPDARRWLVLCGGGNNGGDGYVIAREAHRMGLEVEVLAMKPVAELAGDAARAAADCVASGIEVNGWSHGPPDDIDLVVDALLGTGLDREVSGQWADAISWANDLSCPVVAVDIPSGLQADTGQVLGRAMVAELTVSFIGQKRGLFTADGPDHAGQVLFSDLDVPQEIYARFPDHGCLDDASVIAGYLPPRKRNAHKGSYGHVLVVAGNVGMSGAARLTGEAALRSGAGLVSVATHPAHALWLNPGCPELMVQGVAEPSAAATTMERATVLACGPGLGTDDWARGLFQGCLESSLPLVLDADGLNLLAKTPHVRTNWVLTPHPAEAARLLKVSTADVQADRFAAAVQLARDHDATVVLKGCGTVVAAPDGRWQVCALGNPGMATAGSGDVLTGVVAGMLAQGLDPFTAARVGVAAHAAAGDLCARQGERGMLASEIMAFLPAVLNAHD